MQASYDSYWVGRKIRPALFCFLGHMSITEFIILALATYRITNLFVDDDEGGPWDTLHILRYHAGVRYDEEHRKFGTNTLARAMTCFWCFSFWVGVFVMLVFLIPNDIGFFILLPFSLSGAALVAKRIV
jgi:hypothetical protein